MYYQILIPSLHITYVQSDPSAMPSTPYHYNKIDQYNYYDLFTWIQVSPHVKFEVKRVVSGCERSLKVSTVAVYCDCILRLYTVAVYCNCILRLYTVVYYSLYTIATAYDCKCVYTVAVYLSELLTVNPPCIRYKCTNPANGDLQHCSNTLPD